MRRGAADRTNQQV